MDCNISHITTSQHFALRIITFQKKTLMTNYCEDVWDDTEDYGQFVKAEARGKNSDVVAKQNMIINSRQAIRDHRIIARSEDKGFKPSRILNGIKKHQKNKDSKRRQKDDLLKLHRE
jgi:hypothetical protein